MPPYLSLVGVLGALAATSGQGTECTCTVDPVSVAELAARPVPTASRQDTRFLFLLGYPHMGTSAVQFLLSTSASVSGILGNRSRLGPSKEGMAHFEHGRPREGGTPISRRDGKRSMRPRLRHSIWRRLYLESCSLRTRLPKYICLTS